MKLIFFLLQLLFNLIFNILIALKLIFKKTLFNAEIEIRIPKLNDFFAEIKF